MARQTQIEKAIADAESAKKGVIYQRDELTRKIHWWDEVIQTLTAQKSARPKPKPRKGGKTAAPAATENI